jgi:ABC-2 type transport system ATP-binding protein
VTNVPAARAARAIDAAVESMGLEPMLDRLAKTFSGGMLRRLEIATAVLNRPAVLFLDEPTVGLDPTRARSSGSTCTRCAARPARPVLVTTHLMEEADRHCDRLAIMDMGAVVELGAPDELRPAIPPSGLGGRVLGRHRPLERGREVRRCPRPAPPGPPARLTVPPRSPAHRSPGWPPAPPRCRSSSGASSGTTSSTC